MKSELMYFKPSIGALLFGGFIGSMLLVVFIGVYHWRMKGGVKDEKEQRNVVADLLSLFLQAFIVSVVIILLMQRVSDLELPIVIEVRDYLGGIVIGLFSVPISDFLYKKLANQL